MTRSHGATVGAASVTIAEVLECAMVSALLAGSMHSGFVAVRVFVMHKFSWASRDIVWMAPVSYAAFIVPVAVAIFALMKLAPRTVSSRTVVAAPIALAVFGVLMLVRVIHPLALFVLALGVALQIAQKLLALGPGMSRLLRRVGILLVILVVVTGAVVRGIPRIGEERALNADAPAAGTAPSVLLIILDTVRAASMGMYGYRRDNTPRIEAFAREGVRFDWAMSPSSWTLPSHASLFTGLDAKATEAGWKWT